LLLVWLQMAGAHEQAVGLAYQLPGRECLGSSASKRNAKINSGSAGRLMAAPPGHGIGEIWIDVAGFNGATGAEDAARGGALAVEQERYAKLPRADPLTCSDAGEMLGFA
jgi:hypothetical protein